MDSKDRAEFDAVFGLLVEQQRLVTVEGDETLWRLADPITKAAEDTEGGG